MTTKYEEMPTFLGYSEEVVGVIAGGGAFGYGCVVLHEPTEEEFHRISTEIDDESPFPKAVAFNYSDVATITVSGLLKWTNSYLERAPKRRQDIKETGEVRIELFDEEQSREFIEAKSKMLEKLGIKFIG